MNKDFEHCIVNELDKKPRQKIKIYKNKDVFTNSKNPNKIISKVKQKQGAIRG